MNGITLAFASRFMADCHGLCTFLLFYSPICIPPSGRFNPLRKERNKIKGKLTQLLFLSVKAVEDCPSREKFVYICSRFHVTVCFITVPRVLSDKSSWLVFIVVNGLFRFLSGCDCFMVDQIVSHLQWPALRVASPGI